MKTTPTKSELDNLTYKIIGAAIEVHKNLGPGLLESLYHKCLKRELDLREISYCSELVIPVHYKGFQVSADLPCDFLIEDKIVVDLKATWSIAPIFKTILLTYMKLLRKPKVILINFNCTNIFKEGQSTYVNEYFEHLPD